MNVFKIPCTAHSPESARLATFEQHRRVAVSWVQDGLSDVLNSVQAKRARALENPRLYSDKLDEYDHTIRKLYELVDSEEQPAMAIIEALRLNGDGRLADTQRVCAVWVAGDRWIVFGASD